MASSFVTTCMTPLLLCVTLNLPPPSSQPTSNLPNLSHENHYQPPRITYPNPPAPPPLHLALPQPPPLPPALHNQLTNHHEPQSPPPRPPRATPWPTTRQLPSPQVFLTGRPWLRVEETLGALGEIQLYIYFSKI